MTDIKCLIYFWKCSKNGLHIFDDDLKKHAQNLFSHVSIYIY